ncbi:hypothetical protein ABEV74_22960 [Paenibacillus cisolokensis]|jgi:hypothetical protein|uniref:hypothetical protein n=1 Tax=Paenibacillus cisolokensis TaxID=1658519 RepID=UPI003D2BF4C6
MCKSFQQKHITLLRTSLLVVMLSGILIGCSQTSENKHAEAMVFQGEGKKWEVSIPNEVIIKNGQKYFPSIFRFKGDLEELNEVEYISFALGTDQSTQIINVYDPTYKEKLMKTDGYHEEYEDQYGIIIDVIKNRKTNVFEFEYVLEEASGFTTLDSIKENGVLIMIQWEDQENQFKDQIHSRNR